MLPRINRTRVQWSWRACGTDEGVRGEDSGVDLVFASFPALSAGLLSRCISGQVFGAFNHRISGDSHMNSKSRALPRTVCGIRMPFMEVGGWQGLKPAADGKRLRGAEAPLFHGGLPSRIFSTHQRPLGFFLPPSVHGTEWQIARSSHKLSGCPSQGRIQGFGKGSGRRSATVLEGAEFFFVAFVESAVYGCWKGVSKHGDDSSS